MDQNLLVAIGKDVTSGLGVTKTNARHDALTLEAATDTVVNTLRLAPTCANTMVTVGFVASEATCTLLHNLHLLSVDENHFGERLKMLVMIDKEIGIRNA